jgi:hypothetical protein
VPVMAVDQDGDRDPISAGTVGEAVGGGGSMAEVGMPANPDGAHQVNRHMVDREAGQWVVALGNAGRAMMPNSGPAPDPGTPRQVIIG